MADVVIRGMRIPPQCVLYDEYRSIYYKCPFADEGKWGVLVCTCPNQKRGARIVNEYTATRHPDCPLVPLPEGHGRCIDVDALEDMDFESCDTSDCHEIKWRISGMNHIRKIIKDAPTIVPAEGVYDSE